MKRQFLAMVRIAALIALLPFACTQPGTVTEYNIGDTVPAGRLIFYINPNAAADGWKYLEAAPSDLTSRVWGTYNFGVTGADGTAIGTGEQNTSDIITYDTATSNKAADECAAYSIVNSSVTYDDWFLPSKDELNEMYVELKSKGLGGFSDGYYWSSSEYNNYNTWLHNFFSGVQPANVKDNTCQVRAVRAF